MLHFSDIVIGPKAGNTDSGTGDGAIVTVWGVNLGGTHGDSKVFINGAEAARIYSWENATGPADLYTHHKMQVVSFQISHLSNDGAGGIYVVVNGKKSNSLPFTIPIPTATNPRKIYFVGPAGNDTNPGTFDKPWATLKYAVGAGTKASPVVSGDIIYALDGTTAEGDPALPVKGGFNSVDMPKALIAYPGAKVKITGTFDPIATGYSGNAITNSSQNTSYWVFSKLYVEAAEGGIGRFIGTRVIGCNITGPTASGQSGAIYNISGASLGNYIHHFGGPDTVKKHHVFYISTVNAAASPLENIDEPFELGWNYLKDNMANNGLHMYDEAECDLRVAGIYKVHDNVVVSQRGIGISITTGNAATYSHPCYTKDMTFLVYNNVLINVGLGPQFKDWTSGVAVRVKGDRNHANIQFLNNTIYGYGDRTLLDLNNAVTVGIFVDPDFGGQWEWRNNIMVDTNEIMFVNSALKPRDPLIAGNNLWFSTKATSGIPAWANVSVGDVFSNPLFMSPPVIEIDPATADLQLQSGSPARDVGFDTWVSAPLDFLGIGRPQGTKCDIGAYEFH